MRSYLLPALFITTILAGTAGAQEDNGGEGPNIVPPPPPEELTQGEAIEPSVQILSRPWAEIREYSVNGRVYAVRIKPRGAPAYYLYDTDADGILNERQYDALDAQDIHQWELFRW